MEVCAVPAEAQLRFKCIFCTIRMERSSGAFFLNVMVSLCYLESVTIDGSFDEAMFSDADVGTRAGKISLQRLGGESGA